jgi:hypothetical protein
MPHGVFIVRAARNQSEPWRSVSHLPFQYFALIFSGRKSGFEHISLAPGFSRV